MPRRVLRPRSATYHRIVGRDTWWDEIGPGVFTRRYAFYDQQIGLVLGDGEALVIDTRTTRAQARQVLEDIASITPLPVRTVVNTHWHYDHTFGNHDFRPAAIWGHERSRARIIAEASTIIDAVAAEVPRLATEIREVELDPPERTFAETARLEVGGRIVDLRFHGRGHTDGDIVVEIPDAGVTFAGDLLEGGAPPYFGDGYPLDWPETVSRVLERVRGPVVPGHGPVGDRGFVEDQLQDLFQVVTVARALHRGELDREAAIAAMPYAPRASVEPLDRALAQLRGELDRATPDRAVAERP